ncbi:hypothetical protein NE865_08103 [Phthorimaea operculella]|nr:hypothetical protein NE865_08103 [Phthorimaea operculella]
MALPRAFTTLGELAELDEPGEREVLDRLIEVVDLVYPPTWRDWRVVNFSKEDLFGLRLEPQTLNKLRFAIPTISIIKSFDPEAVSVSEKRFKTLKLSLLNWSFCRALIMSPRSVASKIHGSSSNLEIFISAIGDIGGDFISREEAESLISGKEKRKRPSSQSSQYKVAKKQRTDSTEDIRILKEQTRALQDMMSNLLSRQYQKSHNYGHEGNASGSEEETPFSEVDKENDGRASSLFQAPDMDMALPGSSNNLFDFTPCIKEAEPKIMRAPSDLLEQGVLCQKFGTGSWASIRYNEANKKLQATPAFTSLSVNPQLAGKTPNWVPYEQVVKYDQTLGALTHGLLQQRKLLIEVLSVVANEIKSNALNDAIKKHITGPETDFKKFNDELLQYTCGRRAELIEFRRSLYKPPSKFMNDVLHNVPPSSTHLFEENALSETFKQNGGFYKFFPASKNSSFNNSKHQDYKESTSFQAGKQQFKKTKPQSSSTSSSVNRGFRKSYEATPNNRKREGGAYRRPSSSSKTSKP